MSFDVAADSYLQFMGRFSDRLSAPFADLAGVAADMRVLDVGCGPGVLTAELVERVGAERVVAVDPSASFVAAVRTRLPEVDVRAAAAEQLPFDDESFDAVLAQLVVHFMPDPEGGLAEMTRVARPGARVAVSVWDQGGERGPVSTFWAAAKRIDPTNEGEAGRFGTRAGELVELLQRVGLDDVRGSELLTSSTFATFEEWWQTYLLGVGPAGDFVRQVDPATRAALRDCCAELLGEPPFTVDAVAWAAVGTAR